jgi:hypothetical protein
MDGESEIDKLKEEWKKTHKATPRLEPQLPIPPMLRPKLSPPKHILPVKLPVYMR